jgi:Co/Zn/Cd efflux system component
MNKTTFKISKMDCSTEEQMIRMKLDGLTVIKSLDFDIPNRKLTILHTDDFEPIFLQLDSLNFDTSVLESGSAGEGVIEASKGIQKKILVQVLVINFVFFALELTTGFISNSMGLVADSLDMLADSIVYGLALIAVGGTIALKKNIARVSGYMQITLAVLGIAEVIRRFTGTEAIPEFGTMIIISVLALLGNTLTMYLLMKAKSKEAHMKASMICTSNDVIVNFGVILAGALVYFTNSKYPDLIVGTIVFLIVARGAFRILKLAK